MYGNTDYGPVQNIVWCSRTGRNYRAQIQLLNTNPSANPPSNRFELLEDGCSIVWDTGSAGMLAPVAPSKLTLKVTSLRGDWRESLGMLMGRPDGAVRCFIEADDNEDGLYETVEWAGYLEQALSWQTTTESGIRDGVTLAFVDGFGFVPGEPIFELPVTEADDMRYLNLIKRFLSRLAGTSSRPTWETIIDAIAYRPWVPDGTTDPKISSLQDPLWYLMTDARFYNEVFEDGDGVDSVQFTRLLASRFNARMYQSAGQWHIDQPSNIGRSASIFGSPRSPGRIRSWTSSLQSIADPGTGSHDIRRLPAARTWELVEAPTRAQDMPTQLAQSNYDFEPDIDNWILNPSFELQGDAANIARYWDSSQAGQDEPIRETLQNLNIPGAGFNTRWAAFVSQAGYSSPLFIESVLTPSYIVGNEKLVLHFSHQHYSRRANPANTPTTINDSASAIAIGETDFVTAADLLLEVAGDVAWANGMKVHVDGLVTTSEALPDTPQDGVLAIPKGTNLYFYTNNNTGTREIGDYLGSIELTENAFWGQDFIVGNPEPKNPDANNGKILQGATALFGAWKFNAPVQQGLSIGQPHAIVGSGGWVTFNEDVTLPMVRPNGIPVEGYIRVWCNHIFNGSIQANETGVVDNVRVNISEDNSELVSSGCIANNEAIAHGLKRELPTNDGRAHIIGDGPIDYARFAEDSGGLVNSEAATRSAIGVGNPSPAGPNFVDYYPTAQGANTSWTSGQFQNGDPSTGGPDSFIVAPGIDCLCAEDSIRLLSNDAAGGQQLINGTIMLPSGDALHPHQVPLLSIRTYTATQYFTTAPLRVSYPPDIMQQTNGVFVAPTVSACIGGVLEERNVESVQRQDSWFLVELETPFSEGMPVGTEVNVHVLAWWTRFEWDLMEDTVDFQGQSIVPNDDLSVTHRTIWNT